MKNIILNRMCWIVLLAITFPTITNACSCGPYEPVFCRIVNENLNIVRVVVNNHPAEHLMEVSIIENIHKEISESTIIIYGQDGLTCGETLSRFDIQDTLVLAVIEFNLTGDDYWYLEGWCGLHWLKYENGMLIGQITDSLTTQSLEDFKDNLFECHNMTVPTDNIISEGTISVFPNPVSQELYISSEIENILGIDISDMRGQRVNAGFNNQNRSTIVDVNNLMNGVYFVRIRTSKGILTRKFLKI